MSPMKRRKSPSLPGSSDTAPENAIQETAIINFGDEEEFFNLEVEGLGFESSKTAAGPESPVADEPDEVERWVLIAN